MPKSLSLALYLATRTRRDRASGLDADGKALTEMDKSRQAERAGEIALARAKGPLIWIHTGQDPRATAIREFVRRLQSEREELNILLTTGAEMRLDSEASLISQFAPDETLTAIRRFLGHWTPDIAIWSEPDPRPALIAETARHGVPMLMVDAGTARPDPQAKRWFRGVSGTMFAPFRHVLAANTGSAAALRKLGATPNTIEVTGFLEEGTAALLCNEADRAAMARVMGGRPVWLAAHVTLQERAAVIAAHSQAQRRAHRLLLVLIPDGPAVGPDWARDLATQGHSVALRSAKQRLDSQTQIYIADVPQEMGLWYRLAPISFLGQSLEPKGGVNPFEAAALGSAILHGPHVERHQQSYARLAAAKAACLVPDADSLGPAIETLLNPDVAATMAHGAWQVCSSGAAVTDRMMDLILTTLDSKDPN